MSRYEAWLEKFVGKKLSRDPEEIANDSADNDYSDDPQRLWIVTNFRSYSEDTNWDLSTGLELHLQGRVITRIDITARVYAFGDSGLGDVWPEDVWKMVDYRAAKKELEYITE